jgi:zinc protease
LRLVIARSTDIPLVTLKLVVPGGDAVDPESRAGLGDVTAALALRGAGGRDAAGIAQAIAALGGSISATSDPDATTFTLSIPAANAEAGGRILADLVLRPTFAQSDLERVRKLQADALAVASRQPMQAALRLLPTAMFRGTPYGALPTAATIAAIERADVDRAFAHWVPAGSTLIVTGALPAAAAQSLAQRLFGGWRVDRAIPLRAAPITSGAPQVIVVDIPSAGQAAVLAGLQVAGRNSAEWEAMRIVNARLGSGFQGFLSQEIRVKRGLSYGAGSLLDPRRNAAILFSATQTRNETADQVVGLVVEQMARLSREPMTEAEAAERTTFVTNILANQTERTAGLADYLAGFVAAEAPLGVAMRELSGAVPSVEQLRIVSNRYFARPAPSVVVAGDSAKWLPALRVRFPQLVVVKADGSPAQ